MQPAICYRLPHFSVSVFQLVRRSRAARRRIVIGMKIAEHQPNLSSFKLFRFLCPSPFTNNPSLVTIFAFQL